MMANESADGRLPGERTRAWLAQACGPETMARIVDPVLADLQHETLAPAARAQWLRRLVLRARWLLALGKALLVELVLGPRHAADHHAPSRVVGWAMLGCAAVASLELTAFFPQVRRAAEKAGQPWLAAELLATLLPSAPAMGIPVGMLVGALSITRQTAGYRSRWTRQILSLTLVAVALTAALMTWAMPPANQAFRKRMWLVSSGDSQTGAAPAPGPNEMALSELRNVALRHEFSGKPAHAARYWAAFHLRFAIPAACVVFACLGTVLAGTWVSSSVARRLLCACVVVLAYYLLLTGGTSGARALLVGPLLGVWFANVFFATVAAAITVWNVRHRPAAQGGLRRRVVAAE